jgi:hypothetical protein
MPTVLNFKDIIDLPKWRSLATPLSVVASNYGLTSDFRNNGDIHPFIYRNIGTSAFHLYNTKRDEWLNIASPTLASSFTSSFFMSAQGPRGTITTTGTNNSFTISTALPAAVGINQLANRGDGRGFKVRVIGNSAGGSGKTEERLIVANTSGTIPTINVDIPFSFVPATGDIYEFLSGRVFMLGNAATAGSWKYYDVLTNSFSGNLSVVNLIVGTGNNLIGLDEALVPYDRSPGEGFLGSLTATASGAASLKGQAAGGDAGIAINQYRNFQIRIVNDTGTPTAAGQRRNITSHTAGPSPVYTVPAWAVQPSATAQYVIENNGDRMLLFISGKTNTFTYNIAANAWDTTTFSAGVASGDQAYGFQMFGIEPDIAGNAKHSFILRFRAPTSVNTLDQFDIAGAATGTWTSGVTYGNAAGASVISLSGTLGGAYDPATMQGRYMYLGGGTQLFYRFDMQNRVLEPYSYLRATLPAGVGGTKGLGSTVFVDGNTKLSFIILSLNIASVAGAVYSAALPITR